MHVENPEILTKVSLADAEYVSTVEPSIAQRGTPSSQNHRDVHDPKRRGTACWNLSLQFTLHRKLHRTAQFALCVTVVTAATTDSHHSVDELLEPKLHDTRDVDEVLAQYLFTAPFEATKPRMTRAPAALLPADPVAEGGDRDKHFHQLFRLLRLTGNRTRIDELDHGHQLVHHLRLRYSKRGHHGSDVGKVLHGVWLYPLPRPRLSESLGPHPARLFFEQLEELRLGRRGLLSSWRVVLLALHSLATVIRSCRSHERSRRCRRLIAAPAGCSSLPRNDHVKSITKKGHTKTRATLECRLVLLLLMVVVCCCCFRRVP